MSYGDSGQVISVVCLPHEKTGLPAHYKISTSPLIQSHHSPLCIHGTSFQAIPTRDAAFPANFIPRSSLFLV